MCSSQANDSAMLILGTPSSPNTGQAVYGNLLKLLENKLFWLNYLPWDCRSLLNLLALRCFGSYKIDYSENFACVFVQRNNEKSASVAAALFW